MPNGKHGDNPLSDFIIYGRRLFPPDVEDPLRRIDATGAAAGRWPLGQNWPYSPREFDWAEGKNLDDARRLLRHLLEMLEAGRGDEVIVDPLFARPLP